jgi:hypothetical protein
MSLMIRPAEIRTSGIGWLYIRRIRLLFLAAAFVLSRLLYNVVGILFDAEPLKFYLQYIDPHLLRTEFWRSIYYLEQQPPLFNC